jgi:hypothetical protein
MAARPTLTGTGYVYGADASHQCVGMTGPGPVAPRGAKFVALKVRSVAGGSSPQCIVRNGRSDSAPIVQQVAAVANNTIDRRSTPDTCGEGLWLSVTGAPRNIEIEVMWK